VGYCFGPGAARRLTVLAALVFAVKLTRRRPFAMWPLAGMGALVLACTGLGGAGHDGSALGGSGGAVASGGAGGSAGGSAGAGAGSAGSGGAGSNDPGGNPGSVTGGIGDPPDGGNADRARDLGNAEATPELPPAASGRGQAGGDCPAGVAFGDPVPAGASATLVKSGFLFTEGPVWVPREKALFFTEFDEDGSTGRIHRHDPVAGTFALFFEGVGVNGLAVDERGGLVGASHGLQGITRFDVATRMRVPIPGGEQYDGKKFNSPNDVVVRADGNIYFSDPSYQRPAGSAGQGLTAFYHWKAGIITRHGAGPQPNAIGISVDGKWLYVTSSMTPPVRRFALADDGAVGESSTFVNTISQGFAIDCAGNVYLTSDKMVRVFSPAGQARGTIGGFPQDLTNLAFGDEDRRTLYITVRPGSLYKVRLGVPGFPN
jgi:gluconolactonase